MSSLDVKAHVSTKKEAVAALTLAVKADGSLGGLQLNKQTVSARRQTVSNHSEPTQTHKHHGNRELHVDTFTSAAAAEKKGVCSV